MGQHGFDNIRNTVFTQMCAHLHMTLYWLFKGYSAPLGPVYMFIKIEENKMFPGFSDPATSKDL